MPEQTSPVQQVTQPPPATTDREVLADLEQSLAALPAAADDRRALSDVLAGLAALFGSVKQQADTGWVPSPPLPPLDVEIYDDADEGDPERAWLHQFSALRPKNTWGQVVERAAWHYWIMGGTRLPHSLLDLAVAEYGGREQALDALYVGSRDANDRAIAACSVIAQTCPATHRAYGADAVIDLGRAHPDAVVVSWHDY